MRFVPTICSGGSPRECAAGIKSAPESDWLGMAAAGTLGEAGVDETCRGSMSGAPAAPAAGGGGDKSDRGMSGSDGMSEMDGCMCRGSYWLGSPLACIVGIIACGCIFTWMCEWKAPIGCGPMRTCGCIGAHKHIGCICGPPAPIGTKHATGGISIC